ncbi:hypothetical protein J588_4070, partial [Acinetobacter sp. 1578804]
KNIQFRPYSNESKTNGNDISNLSYDFYKALSQNSKN